MKHAFCLTMCLLTFLLSCAGDKNHDEEKQNEQTQENQEDEGFYETILVPMNTGLAGSTTGNFQVKIFGDEFKVTGQVQNSPQTFHRQFIHTGGNCPGPGADQNLDGMIDLQESLSITGQALIPLDQNLSTQTAGFVFPIPDANGNYTYAEKTSLVTLYADLRSADPDSQDFITKLSPDESLNLSGRTIVLYGIKGNSDLPIACGTLVRGVEPLPEQPTPVPPPAPKPPPPPPHPVPPPPPQPPKIPIDDEFSTQVTEEVLIEGTKCHGGEMTPDHSICFKNQWLVTIDRVDVDDQPFVANLILVGTISTATTAFYNIVPVSSVDMETFQIAKAYWVKFMEGADPIVLKKTPR